ncbi:MAG: hypothetical protein F6K10_32075 [Moorea sp. SIO2B7]|nr:hypothetical protein [Moorena sp. SIO2B7]
MLVYVNHWEKSRDKLLYVDREGLYQVKAAILEKAVKNTQVQVIGYIDRISGFVNNLHLEDSSNSATNCCLAWLDAVGDSKPTYIQK